MKRRSNALAALFCVLGLPVRVVHVMIHFLRAVHTLSLLPQDAIIEIQWRNVPRDILFGFDQSRRDLVAEVRKREEAAREEYRKIMSDIRSLEAKEQEESPHD